MRFFAAALLTVSLLPSLARANFLPPDFKVDYSALSVGPANMDEKEFREVIDKILAAYQPVAKQHGGNLVIQGDWKAEELNAGARQIFSVWQVMVTGGVARRPELTPDGFALVVCHEVGHHLGGYPFQKADVPMIGVWSAAEGEADYFSTHVCARKIWGKDLEKNASFRQTASRAVRNNCDRNWTGAEDQNLCYRVVSAVESMTATMAGIMKKPVPNLETPDPAVVPATNTSHPDVQCRMDTTFQGAICGAPFSEKVIPGKKVGAGPFSPDAEREAAANSCMAISNYRAGLRPTCWFKPQL